MDSVACHRFLTIPQIAVSSRGRRAKIQWSLSVRSRLPAAPRSKYWQLSSNLGGDSRLTRLHNLIPMDVRQLLHLPAGPPDPDSLGDGVFAQAETDQRFA